MLMLPWRKKLKDCAVSLSPTEVTDFIILLDRIENEKLWNLALHIAVGDYMLKTGVSFGELMRRYEAVCPQYRKKDFPLRDGLTFAGAFMQDRRLRIITRIYNRTSEGESFDPKEEIEREFLVAFQCID